MRIVVTSDMHMKFKEVTIPNCDILIDCGDYSFRGTEKEIFKFYKWFNEQPAKHLISVQGNHEKGFESNPERAKEIIKDICPKVHLLHDNFVTIEGIKIYGSPWTPEFFNWAYNVPRGEQIAQKWRSIPEDTDILITHGPPYGILDGVINWNTDKIESVGCLDLRDRVQQLNLKYHFFGHLHLEGGKIMGIDDTTFCNAAINDDQYKVKNKPLEIEYEFEIQEEPLEDNCE